MNPGNLLVGQLAVFLTLLPGLHTQLLSLM